MSLLNCPKMQTRLLVRSVHAMRHSSPTAPKKKVKALYPAFPNKKGNEPVLRDALQYCEQLNDKAPWGIRFPVEKLQQGPILGNCTATSITFLHLLSEEINNQGDQEKSFINAAKRIKRLSSEIASKQAAIYTLTLDPHFIQKASESQIRDDMIRAVLELGCFKVNQISDDILPGEKGKLSFPSFESVIHELPLGFTFARNITWSDSIYGDKRIPTSGHSAALYKILCNTGPRLYLYDVVGGLFAIDSDLAAKTLYRRLGRMATEKQKGDVRFYSIEKKEGPGTLCSLKLKKTSFLDSLLNLKRYQL